MKKKKLILLFITLLTPLNVYAREQTGKVLEIRVTSKQISSHNTHIKLSGIYNNPPACIDQTNQFWSIDTDTTYGKSILSAILSAQSMQKDITFWGTTVCHPGELGPNGMEEIQQIGLK